MTTKSNEIIRTIRDLLRDLLSCMCFMGLCYLSLIVINAWLKEIEDMGLVIVEVILVFLCFSPLFYLVVGSWALENANKTKKDEIDTENKTAG